MEKLNITLAAILSFALAYHATNSLTAALIIGIPTGMAGGIIAVLFAKKFWPRIHLIQLPRKSPFLVLATAVASIAFLSFVFFFFQEEDAETTFLWIYLCFGVILNILNELLRG